MSTEGARSWQRSYAENAPLGDLATGVAWQLAEHAKDRA